MTGVERARVRLVNAIEEVHAAAHAYGLDSEAVGELYAPFGIRADAWLHRVERDTRAWRATLASPLFSREDVAA